MGKELWRLWDTRPPRCLHPFTCKSIGVLLPSPDSLLDCAVALVMLVVTLRCIDVCQACLLVVAAAAAPDAIVTRDVAAAAAAAAAAADSVAAAID